MLSDPLMYKDDFERPEIAILYAQFVPSFPAVDLVLLLRQSRGRPRLLPAPQKKTILLISHSFKKHQEVMQTNLLHAKVIVPQIDRSTSNWQPDAWTLH